VLQLAAEEFLRAGRTANKGISASAILSTARIEQRLAERASARAQRNFQESDRIRDELVSAGVLLEDKPDKTTAWRRA
jgi:cysteinyl-tRNA synthetase